MIDGVDRIRGQKQTEKYDNLIQIILDFPYIFRVEFCREKNQAIN